MTAGAYLLSVRRRFRISIASLLPDLKSNFSYGRWLLGSDLALLLGNQIYPWFLASLAGPAAVAVFATCQALTNFARMFLIGAQNVLLPSSAHAFAVGLHDEMRRLVRRGTLVLGGGACLFSIVAYLMGGRVLRIIYGPAFSQHGLLVFLLSLSVLAAALTLAPTFALVAARRADANLRVNVVCLILHVTVGLLLVRMYGAMGAAYGLAAGGFTAAALRWLVYRRLLGRGAIGGR
jgi:O-antigen/teichoic acid export membrane protein